MLILELFVDTFNMMYSTTPTVLFLIKVTLRVKYCSQYWDLRLLTLLQHVITLLKLEAFYFQYIIFSSFIPQSKLGT